MRTRTIANDTAQEMWQMRSVRSVMSEMLLDRGYGMHHTQVGDDELSDRFKEGGVLMSARNDSVTCIVTMVTDKVSVGALRLLEAARDVHHYIMVGTDKPTPAAYKRMLEPDMIGWCTYFSIAEVVRNVTRHHLVPKHTRVLPQDLPVLLKRWRELDTRHLPVILSRDPVARYLGLCPGEVVRIDSTCGTHAGVQISFRVVNAG